MIIEALDDYRREGDGTETGPCLQRLKTPPAVFAPPELFDDLQVAVEEIDPVAAQTSHLAQAQPAVCADGDEGSVPNVDGSFKLRDLTGCEEAHLLLLEPRRLDAVGRIADQDVVLHSGSKDSPERSVHLMPRGRLQVTGSEPCHPRPQHRLVELVELHAAELGQDVEPEVVEVDAPRRRPEVEKGPGPLRHPVGERYATGSRIDPTSSVTLCQELALIRLGGLAGPKGSRALQAVRAPQPDFLAHIPGCRGSPSDPHEGQPTTAQVAAADDPS